MGNLELTFIFIPHTGHMPFRFTGFQEKIRTLGKAVIVGLQTMHYLLNTDNLPLASKASFRKEKKI